MQRHKCVVAIALGAALLASSAAPAQAQHSGALAEVFDPQTMWLRDNVKFEGSVTLHLAPSSGGGDSPVLGLTIPVQANLYRTPSGDQVVVMDSVSTFLVHAFGGELRAWMAGPDGNLVGQPIPLNGLRGEGVVNDAILTQAATANAILRATRGDMSGFAAFRDIAGMIFPSAAEQRGGVGAKDLSPARNALARLQREEAQAQSEWRALQGRIRDLEARLDATRDFGERGQLLEQRRQLLNESYAAMMRAYDAQRERAGLIAQLNREASARRLGALIDDMTRGFSFEPFAPGASTSWWQRISGQRASDGRWSQAGAVLMNSGMALMRPLPLAAMSMLGRASPALAGMWFAAEMAMATTGVRSTDARGRPTGAWTFSARFMVGATKTQAQALAEDIRAGGARLLASAIGTVSNLFPQSRALRDLRQYFERASVRDRSVPAFLRTGIGGVIVLPKGGQPFVPAPSARGSGSNGRSVPLPPQPPQPPQPPVCPNPPCVLPPIIPPDPTCPAPSIERQPPTVSLLASEPPMPVVIGQDPNRVGLTVRYRVVVPPVIQTVWVVETRKVGTRCWDERGPNNRTYQVCQDVYEKYCASRVNVFPDPVAGAGQARLVLRSSSRAWIESGINGRYPGARVRQPEHVLPAPLSGGLQGGAYVAEGQVNFQPPDPGYYDLWLSFRTAGTRVTPPISFANPQPYEQRVYLFGLTLIE